MNGSDKWHSDDEDYARTARFPPTTDREKVARFDEDIKTKMPSHAPNGKGKEQEVAVGRVPTNASIAHIEDRIEFARDDVSMLNKKQKLKRHCKRFWICWLLAAIILLAILLPVL